MDHKQFRVLMEDTFGDALEIQDAKGKDYAGEADALRAFKEHAAEAGVTPLQVWAVQAGKGIRALMTQARTGVEGAEPTEQRVADLINYAVFFKALWNEMQGADPLGGFDPTGSPPIKWKPFPSLDVERGDRGEFS